MNELWQGIRDKVYKNDSPYRKTYETEPDKCCDILKVEPVKRAIDEMGVKCWVTGLRCTEAGHAQILRKWKRGIRT